ncbi:MAG: hypothetical protein AW08_00342 [Candidatus Accumulibacter adjunctus]|uniref:Uncharacterized protein n=1 Tax=Candidatus Accumulibacter adjunctus TaxID=1454001 RepID=A0A011PU06_9PROT|nr:MAG: hypothetical protein AW08_00342 [Candidatus Accumulibacter adjunctus]
MTKLGLLAGTAAFLAAALAATSPSQAAPGADTPKEKTMESAKRRVPTVKPLLYQGVRYEPLRRAREQGFAQSGGVLAAADAASGKTLWTSQLYETSFDPNEERDVQEVYIESLALDANTASLVATDERKRRWRVQLVDGKVEALPPAARGKGK